MAKLLSEAILLVALAVSLVLLSGCAAKKTEPRAESATAPSKPMGAPARSPAPATSMAQAPAAPKYDSARPEEAPAGGMYFQNYGTNGAVNTARQPVSTFSIDVDTASYTVARNYLERGQLPPPDAVRVEEFINYFPQRYPTSDRPVSLYLEGGPSPFHAGMHLVKIGLKGKDVSQRERKPAILTFVIDVSGSMNMENRLGLVKRSLNLLLDQLHGDDQVGIVIYGTNGRILLQPTADKKLIRSAIERLVPEGSTNAGEGLKLGYEMAARHYLEGATNRIILCSDGVANTGVTTSQAILNTVADHRAKGITLTAVGFGMGNFNDVLMEQLADKGNGQYAYVDDLDEARRIFVEQLSGTLELVARDVKIQVAFEPDQVLHYRLVGYENRALNNEDFRNNAADAGEMGAGHTVTALYEVQLQGGSSSLGKVTVRYIDPDHKEAVELEEPIRRLALTGRPTPSLRWTAAVAEFAGILKQSPWAVETHLGAVLEVAEGAAYELDRPTEHRDAVQLMATALRLRGER